MVMKKALILIGLLAPVALHAATVYSDTTTDTGGTVFYSTGPFVQIGDRIALAGTDREATAASAQFFAGAGSGTFDATLRFFNVGSPVGSQIGGSFTVTGSITSGNVAVVNWVSLGNLVLPTNVIFTVSVSNLSAGLDLGLTMFEPVTIGSSSNQFFITSTNGTTFLQSSQGNSQDNLYFSLTSVTTSCIPEPVTMLLTLLGIPVIALARKRFR